MPDHSQLFMMTNLATLSHEHRIFNIRSLSDGAGRATWTWNSMALFFSRPLIYCRCQASASDSFE